MLFFVSKSDICNFADDNTLSSGGKMFGDSVHNLKFDQSHKKLKDSLEGSMHQVLFAAEIELVKILVTTPSQRTSNVNIG